MTPVAFSGYLPVLGFVKERPVRGEQPLRVYIESDGIPYIGRRASSDPTPHDPIALRLAAADPSASVLYLGRPCQFVTGRVAGCHPTFWTLARYSDPVVDVLDKAIDKAKAGTGAQEVLLLGYSGGGTIAALLAARRKDVVGFVTIASPMDHKAWMRWKGGDALIDSLNPIDKASILAGIPQWHLMGGRDRNVPPRFNAPYMKALGKEAPATLRVEQSYDHECCWAQSWPRLLRSKDFPG